VDFQFVMKKIKFVI